MPLVIPEGPRRSQLLDQASELLVRAVRLERGLSRELLRELRVITAVVNTYASNLIEGHDTRPREILRAMQGGEQPDDAVRRELLSAALASAKMQLFLDEHGDGETLGEVWSPEFFVSIHEGLFRAEPAWLEVRGPHPYCALPGKVRGEGMDVEVGRHVPPLGRDVERLLGEVLGYYQKAHAGPASRVLAAAAAHHRLLYLHPFSEGNGRTVRLFTHAQLYAAGAAGGGLWSISRGLSRGRAGRPDARGEYKNLLAQADRDRQGDSTDGRGALSQRSLEEFVEWFLEVALDQVDYMSSLYALPELSERLEALAARSLTGKTLEHALPILRRLLEHPVTRREAWALAGQSERTGRAVVKALLDEQLVRSPSERGPLHLELGRPELFPGLLA